MVRKCIINILLLKYKFILHLQSLFMSYKVYHIYKNNHSILQKYVWDTSNPHTALTYSYIDLEFHWTGTFVSRRAAIWLIWVNAKLNTIQHGSSLTCLWMCQVFQFRGLALIEQHTGLKNTIKGHYWQYPDTAYCLAFARYWLRTYTLYFLWQRCTARWQWTTKRLKRWSWQQTGESLCI